MNEEQRVRAFDMDAVNKPIKTIPLSQDEDKIVRALKRAKEEQATSTHYLLVTTGLEYPVLISSLRNLLEARVLLKRGSDYYLAAFPKGVIIYPTY